MPTATPPDEPVKRKKHLISQASTRDVRLELDLLEQEEATTQRWTLRFTSAAMEHRFQWYHEEISLPTSRWACAGTLAALLLLHGGALVQLGAHLPWPPELVATLSLNVLTAVLWAILLWRSRGAPTMHGRFQWVLLATAVSVILIVLGQPHSRDGQGVPDQAGALQTMLFLLMVLSLIATLWNIQFLVYGALAVATVAALTAWLVVRGGGDFATSCWHVVALFLVTLVSLGRSVYRTERGLRSKFLRIRHLLLENLKLAQHNTFMQQQLSSHVDAIGISGIEASTSGADSGSLEQSGVLSPSMVVLGESWMENVLKVLHQLKLQLTGQDEMTRELEYVMQTLTSDQDLFRGSSAPPASLFRRRFSPGGGGLRTANAPEGSDEWLHLIDEQRHQWRRRKSVEVCGLSGGSPMSPAAAKPLRRTTSGFRQTVIKLVDSYLLPSLPSPAVSPPTRSKWTAKRLLARATACDADVDLLEFASACVYPLTSALLTTLEAHNLFVALPIRLEAAAEFALEIESRYQAKNPYHNATHGAFVTWEINLFLRRLHAEVTPLQVLSALIAGAIHDVNHPGLSNAYLVATSSPLAIKYSDDSVLERMHLAEAFQACTKDGCNIFEGLSTDQRRQSRKLIVTMVLATDLSGHLKHVNKLKSKRYVALQSQSSCDLMAVDAARSRTSSATGNGSASPPCLLEADDLVFQTIMMMADVGHATKAFGVHFAWSKLVSEEFFRQGDLERQFHMASISPLCDREHASKFEKSQVGFLEFVVLPLYAAARDVLPMQLDGVVDRIRANNAMWKRRAESVEKGLVPPPPDEEEEVSTTMGQSDSGSGMAQVREEDEGETETEDSERSRSGCSTRGED